MGRWLAILIGNLIGVALAIELATAAYYFSVTGEVYYWREQSPAEAQGQVDEAAPFAFHPYWAFVQRPRADNNYLGIPLAANNHGFQSPLDYPVARGPDDFIVGLFGGSVAAGFGYTESKTRYLAQDLGRIPALAGKKITLLNLATASIKQPQQLMILSYYLSIGQRFDAVINLDGLNEVVSGMRNHEQGVDVSLPANDMFGPMVAAIDHKADSRGVAYPYYELKYKELDALAARCALASCYAFSRLAQRYYHRLLLDKAASAGGLKPQDTERTGMIRYPAWNPEATRPQVFERIAAVTSAASEAMADLLEGRGVLYLHVLQPNQYYKTERRFSREELAVAFSDESYVKPLIEQGYPYLVAAMESLRQTGVRAVDGTAMFDRHEGPLYTDDCCHFGLAGNEILSQFLADQIAQSLDSTPPGEAQAAD